MKLLSPRMSKVALATVALSVIGIYSSAYAATNIPSVAASSMNFQPADFTAVNIGNGVNSIQSVPHLTVGNTNTISNQDIVFVPFSQLNTLSTAQRTQLKAQLDSNRFVIMWSDGSSPISLSDLENELGYPSQSSPIPSNKKPSAPVSIEKPYAVGLVKLPNGQIDHLSFYGTGITQMNTIGLESIWGGLTALRSSPSKGPNANGADPSYLATSVYTFGTDGEVSTTDNLTMNRVNNNTLSVWTDELSYETIPGSQLYSNGETQFNGDTNTNSLLINDTDYSGEQVTSFSPNSSASNTTVSVGVTTDGIGASWSWDLSSVSETSESDTNEAQWNIVFGGRSTASTNTYNSQPGWQMTNSFGSFMFDRNITVSWENWWLQDPWTDSTQTTTVSETDW
jgi:hypothetical protein